MHEPRRSSFKWLVTPLFFSWIISYPDVLHFKKKKRGTLYVRTFFLFYFFYKFYCSTHTTYNTMYVRTYKYFPLFYSRATKVFFDCGRARLVCILSRRILPQGMTSAYPSYTPYSINQYLVEYRPTLGQVSTGVSTDISTDTSVAAPHKVHDLPRIGLQN